MMRWWICEFTGYFNDDVWENYSAEDGWWIDAPSLSHALEMVRVPKNQCLARVDDGDSPYGGTFALCSDATASCDGDEALHEKVRGYGGFADAVLSIEPTKEVF